MIDAALKLKHILEPYQCRAVKLPDYSGILILDKNSKPLVGIKTDALGRVVSKKFLGSDKELEIYRDMSEELDEVDYL